MKCIGYYTIPVFRMEDTEGEPLEYASLDVKSLPLADIARKWGQQHGAIDILGISSATRHNIDGLKKLMLRLYHLQDAD